MPGRLSYRGYKVTESPCDYNRWKPKAPWDIPLKSRNTKMFALTKVYQSSMADWKSYKRGIYIIMYPQTLLKEYCPYLFETCKESTLMKLYEVVCKVEDDLRVNPDKTNKRKANDKENDEHVTGRTKLFFF
nr:hypothetical protein [Tanacetum cinerariifolium]